MGMLEKIVLVFSIIIIVLIMAAIHFCAPVGFYFPGGLEILYKPKMEERFGGEKEITVGDIFWFKGSISVRCFVYFNRQILFFGLKQMLISGPITQTLLSKTQ